MSEAYVVGVSMTAFGRYLDTPMEQLTGEALKDVLEDSGCTLDEIGMTYYSGITNGALQGQHFVPGQIALAKNGLVGSPVINVENACASGSTAFNLAVQQVTNGSCDFALAIGAEKMNIPDKKAMFAVFDGAWDVSEVETNKERLMNLGMGLEIPEGSESPKPYSIFMAIYARFAREHMHLYGTTQRQIAAVSAKNHGHSVHNPKSQFRNALSIEEVLSAPPITYPLTLPMCSPISDGAAAVLVCNKAGLEKLKARGAESNASRSVKVLASVLRSGNPVREFSEAETHLAKLAADTAYEIAGVEPSEVDVAEVHDATAIGEIFHAENLGLAPIGEAGFAAEKGDFSLGGRVPINPSGGLESKGHPIGVTGLAQIYELVTQLRGEAGKRQVDGARVAIQENSGGVNGVEEAAVVVNLFSNRR